MFPKIKQIIKKQEKFLRNNEKSTAMLCNIGPPMWRLITESKMKKILEAIEMLFYTRMLGIA